MSILYKNTRNVRFVLFRKNSNVILMCKIYAFCDQNQCNWNEANPWFPCTEVVILNIFIDYLTSCLCLKSSLSGEKCRYSIFAFLWVMFNMVLKKYYFKVSLCLNLVTLLHALVLNGMCEETLSFVGLSLDVPDLTKIRCSTRFVYSFDTSTMLQFGMFSFFFQRVYPCNKLNKEREASRSGLNEN